MPTRLAKYARPVVVAFPEIVSPSVPLPIVEDAVARMPPVKPTSDEVALPPPSWFGNGYADASAVKSDEVEPLLLKVFQSAEVRRRRKVGDPKEMLKKIWEPLFVIVKSLPAVEVANVTAGPLVVANPVPT